MALNKSKHTIALAILASIIASPALANTDSSGGRGILELLQDVGKWGKALGDSSLVVILAVGLIVCAGGLLTIWLSSKTQNPQNTKTAGVWGMIIGFCLASITGIIEMGGYSITGQASSEYSQFFDGNTNSQE